MINSQKFEMTNGEGLRHIIEVKHEELGQRISESKPKSRKWTKYCGYNNCLKVLENEIKDIRDDEVVCVTDDLKSYNLNVVPYQTFGAAIERLSMFYVKITVCNLKNKVRFFIVYLSKY